MRMRLEADYEPVDVSGKPEKIVRALRSLRADANTLAILERGDDLFIQTCIDGDRYILERGGLSLGALERADRNGVSRFDLGTIERAFLSFAKGENLSSGLRWTKQFDTPTSRLALRARPVLFWLIIAGLFGGAVLLYANKWFGPLW